ncbi:phosphopantothenoylcysteine decarboxylase subunit SIS2 [Rosa sericea]
MAYRGRGGGGGGFGHGHFAKEEPFVPFPDIHLPDAGGILSELDQKKNKGLKEEETLIRDTLNWLMKSEYNLDKTDRQDKDVEISERTKRKAKREIDSFSQYLVASMFPRELTRGSNVRQVSRENVKWDKRNTEKNSEIYWNQIEKREQNSDAKKQKEGENDEEEDEDADAEEEEDEDPSDDDYAQNIDFDDDEDDFNADDGDDEPILEE